jgi:hypothetical protein
MKNASCSFSQRFVFLTKPFFMKPTIFIFLVFFILDSGVAMAQHSAWYKGNLHTHSYWSDGDEYPEMIMDWYKTQGYNFVALSDHNTLASGEKWIKVIRSKMYEDGFRKYLDKFGKAWVDYKLDSGRIHVKLKTYAEYKPLFEDSGFLIIRSEEITDKFQGKPIHLNATNIREFISPQGGISVVDVMQRNIDAVNKQRQATGAPMFPHVNHPNFYYAISTQDMIDLQGERFFEIYNGHPLVHNEGDSLHPGTEEMWDRINLAYLKKGQPLLYGLATDDSHHYHQFGAAYSNAGRGWVMVNAEALTPEALIASLEAGNFYASTGVELEDLTTKKNTLSVKVKAEPGVNYVISFIGVKKGRDHAEILKLINGTEASFTLLANHLYVRARITSNKQKTNPVKESEFESAWTQPVKRE